MSRQLRIIALTVAAVIVALVAGIYVGVLNTDAGRRAILTALKPTLDKSVGGSVTVGGTGGLWPQRMILRDVSIADEEGVWLEVPEVTLRWDPLALISGRIRIHELVIPAGALSRIPEFPEPEEEPPSLPQLPHLPNLKVETLQIGALNVGAEAAGQDTVLRLDGTADMRPDLLQLSLNASTDAERTDRAKIVIDWLPYADRLTADVQIDGPEGGLIANLAGVDHGKVEVSVSGTGPASNWDGSLKAGFGSYGSLYGKLICVCTTTPRFTLNFDANPGPALSSDLRRYLGESPHLEAELFSPRSSTWSVEVTALDLAAGSLTSPLAVTLTEGWHLMRFDLSLGFAPGPALRDEVPAWLGEKIELKAGGAFDSDAGFRLDALMTSPAGRMEIREAALRRDGTLHGKVALHLTSVEGMPESVTGITGKEAILTFSLAGNRNRMIRFEKLRLATAAGTGANGIIAYGPEHRRAEAGLDLELPPAVFAQLTGLAEPEERVTATLRADGPISSLSATLEAKTPELIIDARPIPPAETKLTLKGGLDAPTGRVTIVRRDDRKAPVLLAADYSWPGQKVLHLDNLAVHLHGARLIGETRIDTQTGGLTGQAKVTIPDLAALVADGSGSLTADVSLERPARGALNLTASAESPELRYGDYEAKALKLTAAGPLDEVMVSAQAERIESADIGPVSDLDTTAVVNAVEGLEVQVKKLTALVNGNALALQEPARLTVKDGTTELPSAKFSWGEKGRLTAGAMISPEALTADLDLNKFAWPGQPVLITGRVNVNTSADQAGQIDLRLDPTGEKQVFIKLAGDWNGRTLDLKGTVEGYGKQAALGRRDFLTASIPLLLSREDGSFSVSTEGALEARLNYRGEVSALTSVFNGDGPMLEGNVNADFRIGGTLAVPVAEGSATLSGGRYEDKAAGIELTSVDARVTLTGGLDKATGTLKLTAWDGRDPDNDRVPITGDGEVTLDAEGFHIDSNIRLRKAKVVDRGDLDVTLSGKAKLAGTFPKLTLKGEVSIDRLDLLIPEDQPGGVVDVPVVLVDEKGRPLEPEDEEGEVTAESEGEFEIALALKVRSEGRAFVRGRGLDSEWEADLLAGGTIGEPSITGNLSIKKGNLTFAGRKFDLTTGEVDFTGQVPPDPVLNITAEHETDEGTKAIVRAAGRTSEPEITLNSEPPVPKEQVMALILFGKPVTELSALQALQVTQALAQLTGTGPFGGGSIMDRARRTLGLDLLDLSFGKEDGSVGLTVGRYLTEGVFVSASQDASGQGGKVSVEVEVTDEFSVKTDVGQDATGGVSAQWKKDY